MIMDKRVEERLKELGAVRLAGPDGVERLYVPVPECEQQLEPFTVEVVRRWLNSRREPVPVSLLARFCGVSKYAILDQIHAGRFPEDSIRKMARGIRIEVPAAIDFFESVVYKPLE